MRAAHGGRRAGRHNGEAAAVPPEFATTFVATGGAKQESGLITL